MSDISTIRRMLSDPDPFLKRDACVMIGDGKVEELIPDMVGLLKDSDLGVKEAALNALTTIGGRPVAEAMVPLLHEADATLRNIGIEVLEHSGAEAVPTITTLFDDKDDDVVKFAVDILANMDNDDGALDKLLPALVCHVNANVRASVAVCLGKMKIAGAAALLQGMLDDPEEWVRFSVVEGLGKLEERSCLPALMNVIEKDSGMLREAAFDAVGRLAGWEDAPYVLTRAEAVLRSGRSLSTGAVVELLEKCAMPGANFKPSAGFKETFTLFLTQGCDDPDTAVRMQSLRGLSILKAPDGLKRLFEFSSSLNDIDEETETFLVETIAAFVGRDRLPDALKEELRGDGVNMRLIVRALGEIKSAEAIPLLEGLMHGADKDESRKIVSALESIGSPDSSAALSRLLRSRDGHTRGTAARALARLAADAAVSELFEALKIECYPDVREEITDALAGIGGAAVSDGFCSMLSSPKDVLRQMAARGLGRTGGPQAVERLKGAVRDENAKVRLTAYWALTMLGATEAAEEIVAGLKDADNDVKLTILKGLAGWPWECVGGAVTGAMRDENLWVRYHAVLLAGEIGGAVCEEAIIEMLERDDAPVKAACAKALEKCGSERAVEALKGYIDHPDPNVRGAVEAALEALAC